MKFLSSLPLLVLEASAAVADPTALTKINAHILQEGGCLSDSQSRQIVGTFNYLLANPKASNFNSTVNALLADDYSEWSDSINFIVHIPLGQPTFTSKAEFISGSGSQPPLILKTLDIFHDCNRISWRWVSVQGAGNDADEVKGINNFYINKQNKIETTYVEFNSAAWLYNLGQPECQ
jgi:hypothetical protein